MGASSDRLSRRCGRGATAEGADREIDATLRNTRRLQLSNRSCLQGQAATASGSHRDRSERARHGCVRLAGPCRAPLRAPALPPQGTSTLEFRSLQPHEPARHAARGPRRRRTLRARSGGCPVLFVSRGPVVEACLKLHDVECPYGDVRGGAPPTVGEQQRRQLESVRIVGDLPYRIRDRLGDVPRRCRPRKGSTPHPPHLQEERPAESRFPRTLARGSPQGPLRSR